MGEDKTKPRKRREEAQETVESTRQNLNGGGEQGGTWGGSIRPFGLVQRGFKKILGSNFNV